MPRWIKGEGWVDRVCATCGKSFQVERNLLKVYPCLYCSVQCANKAPRTHVNFASSEAIKRLYVDEKMTLQQIGDRYGVTLQAVSYHLEKMGIKKRKHHSTHFSDPEFQKGIKRLEGANHPHYKEVPIIEIVKDYLAGQSTSEIGRRYGIAGKTVGIKLRKAGIAIRDQGFGHIQVSKDGHICQSGWEVMVDNWLFEHGIAHECHPKLPNGYTGNADFLALDWYIEVWGVTHNSRYTQRRLTKLDIYQSTGSRLIEIWPKDLEADNYSALHVLL